MVAVLLGLLIVVIVTGAILFGYSERKTTLKRTIVGCLAAGAMAVAFAPFSLPSCTGQTPVTSWLVPSLCLGITVIFITRWDGVLLAALSLVAMAFLMITLIP